MKAAWIVIWLAAAIAGALAAGCEPRPIAARGSDTITSGQGHYSNFTVTKVRMSDGAECYVATESGHGIAMQCFKPPAKGAGGQG